MGLPGLTRTAADRRYGRRLSGVNLPRAWQQRTISTDVPTVGALTTTSAISSGRKYASVTNSGSVSTLTTGFFQYHKAGAPVVHGGTIPDVFYVRFTSLTNGTQPSAPYAASFETDALTLEILFKQVSGVYRILVDGQVAISPTVVAQTNSQGFLPLTFSSRRMRRITFEASGLPFGGVVVDPLATFYKASVASPRVICVGDSYTEGANIATGSLSAFTTVLSDLFGWDDVWASGAGGTGYLAPGSVGGRTKFRDRLNNDVIAFAPDMVIWAGGHNDVSGYTAAALQAEALACYQQVQAALPNCVQVVIGPMPSGGVATFTGGGSTAWLAQRDALKAATVAAGGTAKGVYWIDPNEMPLDATPVTTTLAATIGVNSTSASLNTVIPVGSTVDMEGERRTVTAVSGSGPYAHTLAPVGVKTQHNGGTTVTQVGGCLWTGDGRQPLSPPLQGTIVATPSTTGGTLAAGTYYYKLTAVDAAGETLPSAEFTATTTGSTGKVSVAFQTVPGATSYKLYRGTSTGAQSVLAATLGGTPVVDTGAGSAATPPATNTSGLRNNGNSDLVTSDDSVHPTALGQDMIGRWLAASLKRYVLPTV